MQGPWQISRQLKKYGSLEEIIGETKETDYEPPQAGVYLRHEKEEGYEPNSHSAAAMTPPPTTRSPS
jgi:hypothetical protein